MQVPQLQLGADERAESPRLVAHVRHSGRWATFIGGGCLIVSGGLWYFLAPRVQMAAEPLAVLVYPFAAMLLLIGIVGLATGVLRLAIPFAARPLRNLRLHGNPQEMARVIEKELASNEAEVLPACELLDSRIHVTRNWMVAFNFGGGLEFIRLAEIARAFKTLAHYHQSGEEIHLVEVMDSRGRRIQVRVSDDKTRDRLLTVLDNRVPGIRLDPDERHLGG